MGSLSNLAYAGAFMALLGVVLAAALPAVLAASAYYFWRRDILGTIVAGMALFLTLRLGLGW